MLDTLNTNKLHQISEFIGLNSNYGDVMLRKSGAGEADTLNDREGK